jgi:hypothetical protein
MLEAQDDYDATPAGQAEIRRGLDQASTLVEKAVLSGRLAAAQARRQSHVAAYRAETGKEPVDYDAEYQAIRLASRTAATLTERSAAEREAAKLARKAERAGHDLDEIALDEAARQEMLRAQSTGNDASRSS